MCKRAAAKKQREEDPEAVRAVKRTYHQKHRLRLNAARAKRRWANLAADRAARKSHYDRNRPLYFAKMLRAKYGITAEDYARMAHEQELKCAICRSELRLDRNTHVDHDHETQEIRGLLCHHCNVAIGQFREDPERLMRAVAYLQERSGA